MRDYPPLVSEEPSLIEHIRDQLVEASWESLVPHQAQGRVYAVNSGLQVVDAALAIAEEQTRIVEAWLASGHLQRIETAQWNQWVGRLFQAAIIQPYVVVALIEEAPEEVVLT